MASISKVLKFGGSSVSTPERIKNVIVIVKNAHAITPQIAVVVSAFGGVTDQLILLGKSAATGKTDYLEDLSKLKERHLTSVRELISKDRLKSVLEELEFHFLELSHILEGVCLIKDLSVKSLDFIMSFGERFSAYIISESIKPLIPNAEYLDARKLIKTDRNFGSARVDFDQTDRNIQDYFSASTSMPVITGFIASSSQNETTTLGRGGSDYTAAIVGAALNVEVIEIWTDVDGVMTADPRKEEYAFPIPEMSYREALEMSHFGAKVIHPPTIAPVLVKKIPLHIKNSFNPSSPGTLIRTEPSKKEFIICGISSIDNVALVCLQGTGMIGVCGIAKRLFGALAENGISVILISQGSSEQSICFAIAPQDAEIAKEAIGKEFELEMKVNLIDEVIIERNQSVVAVVGENMRHTPGIAGKLFGALGKNGINVAAIAQGSSELNISVVIKNEDSGKAIKVIHEAFFLSPITSVNVYLIGTGLIGGTLLKKMEMQSKKLYDESSLDLRLVGVANSKSMVFNPKGISLKEWKTLLDHSTEKMNIHAFTAKVFQQNLINSVFVDCTSNQSITDAYESILSSNVSIVTPNKKANSGEYKRYRILKDITKKTKSEFLYGANVGAALPIISTINEMLRCGDKILKIEAILSGTLSYLFNSFTKGTSFSTVVREAQEKGYTEPDPRDDLNGMDVARKLLILARESGYPMEMKDIRLTPFLPKECFESGSLEDFYSKLKKYDSLMENLRKDAEKEGKVLRYIATFENSIGRVSLQSVGPEHPFYYLSGNDNIIAITTEFYHKSPLVIKGKGAGAELTAGKVLADIIRIGSQENK